MNFFYKNNFFFKKEDRIFAKSNYLHKQTFQVLGEAKSLWEKSTHREDKEPRGNAEGEEDYLSTPRLHLCVEQGAPEWQLMAMLTNTARSFKLSNEPSR